MSQHETMDEAVEVEVYEEHPPTRARPAPPAVAHGEALALFGTTDPVEVIEKAKAVAKALMGPVEEQGLYLEKKNGSRYLQVEAWTLLGSMLQVRAIPQPTQEKPDHEGNWHPPKYRVETKVEHSRWCKKGPRNRKGETDHPQKEGCDTYEREVQIVEEPGAGGFTCRVEAIDAAGNVIGAASSRCMWEEWAWRDRDAYALESMAQTRGISKALSGPLRFIVELAGFKGTPAEEVGEDGDAWGTARPASSDDPATTTTKERSDNDCPACGTKVWDNREDIDRRREAGEDVKTPAFRCDNQECDAGKDGRPWATWDPHFFTDPATRAKQLVYKAVKADEEGWARQYPVEDPSYTEREAELVKAATEGTAKEKAGWLWTRLRIHSDIIGWEQGDDVEPDPDQANIVVRAAKIMLEADEPMSELEALETANSLIQDEEAERSAAAGNPYA